MIVNETDPRILALKDRHYQGSACFDPVKKKVFQGSLKQVFGSASRQAGAIISDTTTDAEVVLEEVLGLVYPDYVLRNACHIVSTPKLKLDVDLATRGTGVSNVPPMEEPNIMGHTYGRTNFDLAGYKDVVHVVISDEVIDQSIHDQMRIHIESAAKELARLENGKISTEIETATNTTAGADFATSTTNPIEYIMSVSDSIESNAGGEADTVAADPLVWADYFGNPYIRYTVQAEPGKFYVPPFARGKTFTIPGLPPGWTGIIDTNLTNTRAYIMCKNEGVVHADGPTESAHYRNEAAGYDAYIIRHWCRPEIVNTYAIYYLSSVHA